MSQNKRYYWLKLDQSFFQSIEMKYLKRMAGGPTYINIYLELFILSLETDGMIYFEGIADSLIDELSVKIDEEPDNIKFLLMYAEKSGLIEFKNEDGVISDQSFIDQNIFKFKRFDEMTGSETDSARRTRMMRERNKILGIEEAQMPVNQPLDSKASHCDADVTPMSQNVQKGDTEIDKDKELEIEKELDTEIDDKDISATKTNDLSSSFSKYEKFSLLKISKSVKSQIRTWNNTLTNAGATDAQELINEAMRISHDVRGKTQLEFWKVSVGILRNWLNERDLHTLTIKQIQNEILEQQAASVKPKKLIEKDTLPDWAKKDQDTKTPNLQPHSRVSNETVEAQLAKLRGKKKKKEEGD